ncbi:MAG: LytTR family DNA-binding domain-containing protein [Reichenbachiella sp.]|uniref:LytR/AlgR family response regulator transcription factor n=1 Tax=Reichenbachiella sp. TaxID=2184521 RepID=UPI003298959F
MSISRDTYNQNRAIKAVLIVATLCLVFFSNFLDVGAVLGGVIVSRVWFNQFINFKVRKVWYPFKLLLLITLVSLLSGVLYLFFVLISEPDIREPFSYLYLGRLILFAVIGAMVLIGIKYRSDTGESRNFCKQSFVAIFLIVFLFYFGSPDRFQYVSFPFDDLMDLMYYVFTILFYWTLYLIISFWVNRFSSKYDHMVFVMGRTLLLIVVFLPLDYLLLNVYLQSLYQTTVYADYWVLEMPLKLILIVIVGYFSSRRKQENLEPETIKFQVKAGKATKLISVNEVLFFQVQYQNTYAITTDHEKVVMEESLSDLENVLDSSDFFRLNRQVLVKKEVVKSYEPLANKKLKVQLTQVLDLPQFYEISRLKAPDFRRWYTQ